MTLPHPSPIGPLQTAGVVLTLLSVCTIGSAKTPERGDRDRALFATYQEMLDEDPYQPYALRRLLEVSHVQGGLTGLIAAYEGKVGETPEEVSPWIVLGHLYGASDRQSDAVNAYDEAASRAPKDWRPHLARARLFRKTLTWPRSLSAFDEALSRARRGDDRVALWQEAADAALEGKLLERAQAYYQALRDAQPRKTFLHMEAAATLGRRGFPKAALAAWAEVQQRIGKALQHRVVAWRQIATLQEELGALTAAEATWREGLAHLPSTHWARAAFLEGLVSVYRRRDALPSLVTELEHGKVTDRSSQLILAHLHEELGRDDLARLWLERALAKNSRDVATRLRLIRILERIGPAEALVSQHEALVKTARGEPRHELNLAALYFQQNLTSKGFALLDRVARRYRSDPGVHQRIIDLTMRYGGDKERPRIERTYRTLMRIEPKEEGHIISLGEYWWTSGDRVKARETWRRLRGLNSTRGAGHLSHAEVLHDHGLVTEAREAYKAALAAEPKSPHILRAFARFLEQQKQRGDALSMWRRVLENEAGGAKSAEARRRVVTFWQADGTLGKEQRSLERRFQAQPPELEAGLFLVEILLAQRKDADAQRVLERLRELAPERLETLRALERLYTRKDRVTDAIEVLETLARLDPREAYDHLHRAADLALARGDLKGALETTRRVVALNPAAPGAHDRVGDLYQRMGRMQEAVVAWRQVLLLDPRSDAVRFKLADIYRTLEQPERERQELIHIVRETSQPTDALKAGRRLLQVAIATRGLRDVEDALRPLAVRRSGRSDVYLKLLVDVFVASARAIRWSGRTSEETHGELEALGERALRPLLEAMAGSDVALRARALEVIQATHPPGAVPALSRALLGQSTIARVTIASALGAIGTPSAVAALSRLYDDATGHGQRVAIWALGLAEAPEALDKLAKIAEARHPHHRILAAWAMGALADVRSIPILKKLARSGDTRQRIASIWALGQTPSPAIELTLGSALASTDPLERQLASRALNSVGTVAAQRRLVARLWRADDRPTGHLGDALTSDPVHQPVAEIKSAYAALIDEERGRLSEDKGQLIAATVSAPPSDSERQARTEQLMPLLEVRLAALLSEGSVSRVAEVLTSCLAPANSLMLHPLIPATADQPRTRALLTRLWRSSQAALIDLTTASAGARAQGLALQLLARLGPPALSPSVIIQAEAALQSAWPGVQAAAVAILGQVNAASTPPQRARHSEALMDWYPSAERTVEVRVAVSRALGALKPAAGPESTSMMTELLNDHAAAVRLAAIAGSKGLDQLALLPLLADRINDPVADVARAAIDALRHSDHIEAQSLLSVLEKEHGSSLIWRGSATHSSLAP